MMAAPRGPKVQSIVKHSGVSSKTNKDRRRQPVTQLLHAQVWTWKIANFLKLQ